MSDCERLLRGSKTFLLKKAERIFVLQAVQRKIIQAALAQAPSDILPCHLLRVS